MTTYGVTPEGFRQKSLDEIKADLEEQFRGAYGANINLTATSVFGQIIGIMAGRLDELWQVAAATYRSFYPDAASFEALDNVGSITGALRLAAKSSVAAEVVCTGTFGTALTAGRAARVVGTGERFLLDTNTTLSTVASAWLPLTYYAIGAFAANGGNIYIVTSAGTSAAAGGPTGTGSGIVDGTVEWRFVGAGASYAITSFSSDEKGAIQALAFSLTEIETPVVGWQGVCNLLDAELGRIEEKDEDFRIRREELLRVAGNATVEAIRAKVRDVADVKEVFVFENTSMVTDVNGLPPKSIEVVVDGGAEQDIADAIFAAKPAGIATYGGESRTVTDSQGFVTTIYFSRPTVREMYVAVTVVVDPLVFPIDGATQVAQAVVDKGDLLDIGDDVIILPIRCAPLSVAGVIDVSVTCVEEVFPPTNTANIPIALREVAEFDTSRVAVTVTVPS